MTSLAQPITERTGFGLAAACDHIGATGVVLVGAGDHALIGELSLLGSSTTIVDLAPDRLAAARSVSPCSR